MNKHNYSTSTNIEACGLTEVGSVTYVRPTIKLGRNDPCYCGSGLKFKKCHLEIQKIIKT